MTIDTTRAKLLNEAIEVTTAHRNAQYGEPYVVMSRHVSILNSLGYRRLGGELLEPHDNAIIQEALKLARKVGNPQHKDSWLDTAGYAAIGWEAVVTTYGETQVPITEMATRPSDIITEQSAKMTLAILVNRLRSYEPGEALFSDEVDKLLQFLEENFSV